MNPFLSLHAGKVKNFLFVGMDLMEERKGQRGKSLPGLYLPGANKPLSPERSKQPNNTRHCQMSL